MTALRCAASTRTSSLISATCSGLSSGALVGWTVGSSCMSPSFLCSPAGLGPDRSNERRGSLDDGSVRLAFFAMPELPEVEIVARRLDTALAGTEVESVLAPGMNVMKTFDPPLDALAGREVTVVRRIGKMPVVEFGDLALLIHLMSAGRLRVFDKRDSLKDKTSRVLMRLTEGRELRLREFGTKQRAWAKLLPVAAVAEDEMVSSLGPEAWPPPPLEVFAAAIDQPRHLHPLLRHQRDIAGIGRSWVDEVLWEARLSPFKKGSELGAEEVERLHGALHVLGDAIEHYEAEVGGELPDKVPMPLQVH